MKTKDPLLGRVIVFAIYTICFEAIVWGIFGWAVFIQGFSGWWMLLAIALSSSQMKPQHFGIPQHTTQETSGILEI